jgi:hypothetical protein
MLSNKLCLCLPSGLFPSGFPTTTYMLRMVSSELLRRVALIRTDVSEEPGASFIRVRKICELGTTQAATSNRTLRRNTWYFFAAYVGY